MDANIQQVADAIAALFHGTDPTRRSEADRWISKFQTEPIAWQTSDSILRNAVQAGPEMHFIAAQTLNQKIRFDLKDQLDTSQRIALRGALFEHLQRCSQVPDNDAVCTQLCLALASLALGMEEWNTVFADLENCFNKNEYRFVLLELLQVIPEEFGNHRSELPPTREEYIRTEMRSVSPTILQIILQCAQYAGDNVTMQNRVFHCLGAWVEFGDIPAEQLASSNLLVGCFQAMHNPQLFDAAVDFVIEVFHKYPGDDIHEHPEDLRVIQIILPNVFSLRDWYLKATSDEDIEVAKGLCRVFSHMAESYTSLLLGEQDVEQEQVVWLLLLCTQHPEFEVAQKTFYFWEALLCGLEEMHQGVLQERRMAQFNSMLSELVKVFVTRLRYPKDYDTADAETREYFADHRDFACFLLEKSLGVLESDVVLGIILELLQEAVNALKVDTSNWQATEAALRAARAISHTVSCSRVGSQSSAYIHQILQINAQLSDPVLRTRLRGMALTVAGSYSGWCNINKIDLVPFLEHVIGGFSDPKTCSDAVFALQDFCQSCHRELASLGVFQVLDMPALNTLSHSDYNELIRALCYVLNSLNFDDMVTTYQRIVTRSVQLLQQLAPIAAQGNVGAAKPPGEIVSHHLAVLRTLARYTKFQCPTGSLHPSVALLRELWSTVQCVPVLYFDDEQCIESLVGLFKYTMRSNPNHFIEMVQPMMELVVSGYMRYPLSPYMYAGCVLVSTYGKHDSISPFVVNMLEAFCSKTFSVLSSRDQLVEHPDTVEDMFLLAETCMEELPHLVVKISIFGELFRYGCASITFDHSKANLAAMGFLEGCIWVAIKDEQGGEIRDIIDKVWNSDGMTLVSAVISGIAGVLPESIIVQSRDEPTLSRLLYTMMRYSVNTVEMVRQALKQQTCSHVNQELEEFLTQNIAPAFDANRREFDDLLLDFSHRARVRQNRNRK